MECATLPGGYLGREATCTRGERFPPTRQGTREHGWRLRDLTVHVPSLSPDVTGWVKRRVRRLTRRARHPARALYYPYVRLRRNLEPDEKPVVLEFLGVGWVLLDPTPQRAA